MEKKIMTTTLLPMAVPLAEKEALLTIEGTLMLMFSTIKSALPIGCVTVLPSSTNLT